MRLAPFPSSPLFSARGMAHLAATRAKKSIFMDEMPTADKRPIVQSISEPHSLFLLYISLFAVDCSLCYSSVSSDAEEQEGNSNLRGGAATSGEGVVTRARALCTLEESARPRRPTFTSKSPRTLLKM